MDLATPPLGMMFFMNEEAGTNYGPLYGRHRHYHVAIILFFLVAQKRFY